MKPNDKIEISKVEIEIAGTKLRLSLEQAKELKKILNDAFPDKEVVVSPTVIRYDHTWPTWWQSPTTLCGSIVDDGSTLRLSAHS